MSAQRGFAPVILIALTAIVLLGGGAFLYFTNNKSVSIEKPSSANTPSEDTKVEDSNDFSFELSDKKLLFTGGYADPSVIRFKDTYIMYVNKFGSGGSANLIYTSKDGIDWKETSYKAPGSATARGFAIDNAVKAYYPTLTPINPSDPPSQILSASSTDGLTFTSDSGVRMKPSPGYAIEGPSLIKLEDGTLRMYFDEFKEESKQERNGGRIFGATSTDGLTWTRDTKPSIESDEIVEKIPSDWPQALRPFVLKRPAGGYIMFYNSHSKFFAAYSDDGITWEKLGGLGIKGADMDGFYLPDGNIRIYHGDFSEATSGIVYTGVLKEVEGKAKVEESANEMMPGSKVQPLGGSKPPPPPACVGKSVTDPNLPEECQMWFKIQ